MSSSVYSAMKFQSSQPFRDGQSRMGMNVGGALSPIGGRSLGSTSFDVRPMTAVSGAGYQSQTSDRSRLERKPTVRKRSPHEVARLMEKAVHGLMEESSILLLEKNDPFLSLDKAKEAAKKDKDLTQYKETNSLPMVQGKDLTYAVWFNLAVIYEKNEMYHEAMETYTFLLQQKRFESNAGRVRIHMGNLYYLQRDFPQAIKMFRMALDHTPRDDKKLKYGIHRSIGNILVEMGRLHDAILDYEAVSMSADADLETCYNLLLCHVQTGNVYKAKNTFLKMISIAARVSSIDGASASAVTPSLNSSHVERDLELTLTRTSADTGIGTNSVVDPSLAPTSTAELELKEELGKSQKDSFSLLLTAAMLICTMNHNDEKGAVSATSAYSNMTVGNDWRYGYQWVINQTQEKYPQISHHMEMEMALQHLRKNDHSSAIQIMKSYESKDMEIKAMVAINLSFVYFLEGNHVIADDYANVALASNRFNASALVNKGNSLFIMDEISQAKELYLEALSVDSNNFEASYNLGLANERLGLKKEAKEKFEQLLVTNDTQVLYRLAQLCEEDNDASTALKYLNLFCAHLPTDPGVLARMGRMYEEIKEESQSLNSYLESWRLYPTVDVGSQCGIIFVKLMAFERALDFFQIACQLQPHEIKWRFTEAACLKKLGRVDAALDAYKNCLRDHPNNVECLEYLISTSKELGFPCKNYEDALSRLE